MKGFSDEDAETFAGIVAEPAAFETVFYAKFKTILRAFGDDGDIGMKIVEVLSLARQGHFAIPDDDSHGGFLSHKLRCRSMGILTQRPQSAQRGRGCAASHTEEKGDGGIGDEGRKRWEPSIQTEQVSCSER